MKEKILRRVHALFLVMFAVTLVVAVLAVRTLSRSMASSDWVNQTHALILELDGMVASLQTGEGLMRTYALTDDARDLAAARNALNDLQEHLDLARAMAGAEDNASAAFDRLAKIVNARVEFVESLRRTKETGSADQLRQLLREGAASSLPADFKREVERLRTRQFDLLGERDRESFRQASQTKWIVGLGAGANLLVFVAVLALVREDLANRRRMTAALQEANNSLEQRVRERTAELTATNQRLAAENLERKWTAVSQEHQLRYNQLIVNSVGDLVFVLTKALNITRVNPAVPRSTGFEEESILGQPLTKFLRFHADPASPASAESIARSMRDGRELNGQPAELLDRTGRPQPVHVSVVPLRDNDQVVGGVLVVHRSAPTSTSA